MGGGTGTGGKPACTVNDVYFGYTINDDGVHLFCHRCLWDHNLGFNARITEALDAIGGHTGFRQSEPTQECIERVMLDNPGWSKEKALDHIARGERAGLICLDCGSENHVKGSDWCSHHGRT